MKQDKEENKKERSLTFGNIFPKYLHVIVSVCAGLFMPKSNCMH